MAKRTFEQWVDGIFNHPVVEPAWYRAEDADQCIEPHVTNVEYLTRLFTQCDKILASFDNAQVDQGLDMIANDSCSGHAYAVMPIQRERERHYPGGAPAEWTSRRDCIRAVFDLYAKCFAVRCSEDLGHLSEGENPLNGICYMWWDVLPCRFRPNFANRTKESAECVAVMERCLQIRHDACVEGALHGLGHWRPVFPDRVGEIIDRFLHDRNDLRPELMEYAQHARVGPVL